MSINFDELKESAVNAAAAAAQKTRDLAAIAKANLSIMSEENKIRKAETEIGKLFYRDYALGEEMDSAEYLPWCEKITESKAVIEDLSAMIADLKCAAKAAPATEEPASKEAPAAEEVPVAEEAPAAEEVTAEPVAEAADFADQPTEEPKTETEA